MDYGSLKKLYLDELGDLCDAERQKGLILPKLSELAEVPELREALARQLIEARLHVERLQLIFTHWGEARRSRPCAGLAGIVQQADDRLHEAETRGARDAVILGIARRITHYEIAAIGAARLFARWLNRLDDARLLEESLDEEERADRRLADIADARVAPAILPAA